VTRQRERVGEQGVVVVGAGVAGLTAVRLLEAAGRIGGRAWTTRPDILGGAPFDHGATWLHAARRNPLLDLAQPEDALRNSDAAHTECIFVDGRRATAEEQDEYDRTWDRLEAVVAPALEGPDVSLAEAMAPMADDPWAATVALWEGAIIAAADADVLGLQDWRRNTLEGSNLQPADGVGAFVERRLATAVERMLATRIELRTAVTRIDWTGPGVRLETGSGTLEAAAAIVTVSTGVLAAEGISFAPKLPSDLQAAIHSLPMGLLTKVALPAPAPETLGLPQDALLLQRGGRMTFNAWPQGRLYVTGFMGGRLAWSLAGDDRAAAALAREELASMLGARWNGSAVVTAWGSDQLHRGAYAYAGPGDANQRAVLAAAFPGERLLFAGEACRTDGLAGTVGGAFLSGRDAADRLAALA
jgi:monoamine oxidase